MEGATGDLRRDPPHREAARRPQAALGGDDDLRLFQLHTPRGLSRIDGDNFLPGGEVPRFDGTSFRLASAGEHRPGPSSTLEFHSTSFELAAPVHSRPNTGLGGGDGRSFHLGADHHTHPDRERTASGWPSHHPHSDKPDSDRPDQARHDPTTSDRP
ncbi:hypothetical protein [Saccharothrix variisporea]|uniref:Uncharacterized protein n=1 Tax=Saccharothrix variisporea TaxID=543527 RepID=A0A495X6K5_9PSEU|nr:hypothetical protein [Saccharothrix variisporea]RKT69527.1 hypothetical protein DFJ66_2758 [Saccharothrix variisporea]